MGSSLKNAPSSPSAEGSRVMSMSKNKPSGGLRVVNLIFGFVEKYGLAILVFGVVVFFLWMLYAIDFSSVK
jgi:hypothetical protein